MKPVLTAAEYRRVDEAYEGDPIEAMDKAGYAVALAATQAGAGYGKKVVVLAGPGNNGGDGYVAPATSKPGASQSKFRLWRNQKRWRLLTLLPRHKGPEYG